MAGTVNQYEAMFLFGASAAQDVDGALSATRGIIERHGGTVVVLKKWDERKLAFEVKRQKRGVYIIAYYNGLGNTVAPIERDVNLSDTILRVLITRADHLNPEEMAAVEPQPIIPREERAPWDRPSFGGGGGGGGGGFDRGAPRGPRREEATAGAGEFEEKD